MNQAVLLCLRESQIIEIQRLVMDDDEEGALAFLASVVMPQIEAVERGQKTPEEVGQASGELSGQRRDHVS
jgi:hypothetical protein